MFSIGYILCMCVYVYVGVRFSNLQYCYKGVDEGMTKEPEHLNTTIEASLHSVSSKCLRLPSVIFVLAN